MKNIHVWGAMVAMAYGSELPIHKTKNNLCPEDIDMTPPKKIIPRGCKVYNIDGKQIVAINEKSAVKKYLKTQIT